jgi:tripartite-type tricarboxylate transporter receptor subunit TctC
MPVSSFQHRILRAAAAFIAGLTVLMQATPSHAQADAAAGFPSRPIRVIVPYAAGGGNDILARVVGAKLSELLGGQPLVIENRAGGGGRPAAEWVLNQPHDGYTLFVSASGVMSVAAAIFPKLAYHPTKSFVPLSMIGRYPLIVVIPQEHPAQSVKELVDWAKKNPEKTNYASTSPAFIIANELLKLNSGMPATMVPYKSSGEMVASVAAGHTTVAILDGPPAMPMIQAKKVRAIAVTGSQRLPQLPDVPSMAEAGYPGVDVQLWNGYFLAAGTPPAIVTKLEDAVRRAITDPSVSAKLRDMAIMGGGNSSKEFTAMINKDIDNYVDVVRKGKLKFDN